MGGLDAGLNNGSETGSSEYAEHADVVAYELIIQMGKQSK